MKAIVVLALLVILAIRAGATELGVVYHVGKEDDIKATLTSMKDAGITAVMMGDSPYKDSWPLLDEAVRTAQTLDMKVSLLTSTDWFPEKRYGGVSSAAVKPDGSRGLSFSYACTPAVNDVAGAVSRFVRHFRTNPNVFYLNMVNEVWAWEDRSSWAEKDFRLYLEGLQPDIKYWNKRWGTSYAAFDGIALKDLPEKGVMLNDFDIYRSDTYAKFYSSVYRRIRGSIPPYWDISGQKLYPNYYSNHSTDSRYACLDFYKLFRQHPCNGAWSCHEYGWGSIAAKASKARTVEGLWKRPTIVTESWGGATDDIGEAQKHWEETLRVFRVAKVVYDPDVLFIYQWEWLKDKPEWRKQLKDEIVPLMKQDLGVPLYDDIGILDARAAHYDFDPVTEESYWALNEAASAAGVLPVQVYMNESKAYSLGQPAFDCQPSVLLVPEDRGLYPRSIFEGYDGAVLKYGPGKPAARSIRDALSNAKISTYIQECTKPDGVYEQLYRKGNEYSLAVYNSTGETVRVSYTLKFAKTTASKATIAKGPDIANVSFTTRIGKDGGSIEAEIEPYEARIFRM